MKYLIALALVVSALFLACTKDIGILPQAAGLTDSTLFAMTKSVAGKYTWHSSTSTPDSVFTSAQFHSSVPYNLLMNLTAKNACTDAGKLPHNGSFPDSSLVVKKLYNSTGSQVASYSVLFKISGSWKWAQYNADGSVVKSLNANSDVCTSCHTSDRDHLWTFDSH